MMGIAAPPVGARACLRTAFLPEAFAVTQHRSIA